MSNFITTRPVDAYIVNFTFDASDYESLTDVWNNIINNTLPSPGTSLDTNQLIPTTNLDNNPIRKLSGESDAIWLFLAQTFAIPFSFSAIRICNASMIPEYASDNVTIKSIKVNFTLVDIPTPNSSLLNDKLTSVCLGEWILDTLNKVLSGTLLTILKSIQYAPRSIFKNLKCAGSYIPIEVTDTFIDQLFNITSPSPTNTSDILNSITIPNISSSKFVKLNTNNISEQFSPLLNSKIRNIFGSDIIENVSGVSGTVAHTSPSSIFDYIFMYAYACSFIGAILYGITSIISIDPGSIIVNKNLSLTLNVFLGLSGAISLFVWFDIPNPLLGVTALNPGVVKQNNSY